MTDNENVEETKPVEEVAVDNEIEEVESRLAESGILTKELISEVKKLVAAEVIADLKEDNALKEKELELTREQEDLDYKNYVDRMMISQEPWVDFIGTVRDTSAGQRLEMNWNVAFVDFLKGIGLTGADEEQIVQQYITLLLRDMVDKKEERFDSDYG